MLNIIFIAIGIFVFIGCFLIPIILSSVKSKRVIDDVFETVNQGLDEFDKINNHSENSNNIEEKEEVRYCEYCGSALNNLHSECNSCGAAVSKRK